MPDLVSRYRMARLSLYPPSVVGGHAEYVLMSHTIAKGVPRAQVLVDGRVPGVHPFPTTEQLLEAFDSAIRQHMLARG